MSSIVLMNSGTDLINNIFFALGYRLQLHALIQKRKPFRKVLMAYILLVNLALDDAFWFEFFDTE